MVAVLVLGQLRQTQAARAPWSSEKLFAESDGLVIAQVIKIEVQEDRSH